MFASYGTVNNMETKSFVTAGTGIQGGSVVSNVGTFPRRDDHGSVGDSAFAVFLRPGAISTSDGLSVGASR